MTSSKISVTDLAEAKGFTAGTLAQYGVRNGQGGVVIPYYDSAGQEYIRYHIRVAVDGKAAFRWSSGDAEILPYGVHRPIPYTKGFVWIVEGESDCWTLWNAGIPALGLPGAKMTRSLKAEHVAGVKTVAVIREPEEAGERFPHLVAQRLYDQGFEGVVYSVTLPEKDPRALYLDNPERFIERLKESFGGKVAMSRPAAALTGGSFVSLGECWDDVPEEITWLVDGLLPVGGIGLLSSKPKGGKSQLARNLALAIMRGNRFLGRRCKAGPVLWLALEEHKAQVIAAFKTLGADRSDPLLFHFGSTPNDALLWLTAAAEAHKPALVVIDTWHKLTMIENINDYGAVNRANAPLMQLSRELGLAQLWVHHNNKGQATAGDEVLGSSALFAAADTLLSLRRANDGVRTIRSIQRVGIDLEDTILAMDPDTGVISSAGSKFIAQVGDAREQVEELLSGRYLTKEEITKEIDLRRQVVWSAITDLLKDGIIVHSSGTGKRGDPIRYTGNDEGSHPESPDERVSRSHLYKGTAGTRERPFTRSGPGTATEHQEQPEQPERETDLLAYAAEALPS